MKSIRIASFNTYLICNRFNNNRVTCPEQRASKIRRDFLSSVDDDEDDDEKTTTINNNDNDIVDDDNESSSISSKTKSIPINLDLCFFQEVWGSGIRELTNNIDCSVPPRRSSLFPSPWNVVASSNKNDDDSCDQVITEKSCGCSVSSFIDNVIEMIDTIYFYCLKTGGLYDISTKSSAIECRYRNKHTFTVSCSKSLKGVEATLWDIPQWSEGKKGGELKRQLLVFNTHLDPWHQVNRKKQVYEILDFIDDTLRSIEKTRTVVNDDVQGRQQRQQHQYDWSNTGVLVAGDFNIKAQTTEYYETLMSLSNSNYNNNRRHNCSWKDFFSGIEEDIDNSTDDDDGSHAKREYHHHYHHTYSLQNSLVEYSNDCGRIDYIFGIQRFASASASKSSKHVTIAEFVSKQEQQQDDIITSRTFMTLDGVSRSIRKEPIGAESSDHYALILDLVPQSI